MNHQGAVFFYSPFSNRSRFCQRSRALLLQFVLSSLLCPSRRPDELFEHLSLLPIAFPELGETSYFLTKKIERVLRRKSVRLSPQLLKEFKPFLINCREDEGLLLFVLRHWRNLGSQKSVSLLLEELYPGDFVTSIWEASQKFLQRGFPHILEEFEILMLQFQ